MRALETPVGRFNEHRHVAVPAPLRAAIEGFSRELVELRHHASTSGGEA